MRARVVVRALRGALAAGLVAGAVLPARAQLALRVVVSGLSQPVAFIQDPTDPSVQLIVEKGGRIRVLKAGAVQAADFLDLSALVSHGQEQGLLGLAFAPDYASSRRVYVDFTDLQGRTVIARFLRSFADPLTADPASRFDLRWPGGQRYIVQPYANHNGGTVRFGPDGFLYIGMGDGGSANDPGNRAQDPNTLLGKMLRIDVSVDASDPDGYRIPPDNPFVDADPVAAPGEIWDFGVRNPWKFSFDDPSRGGTGALFIGDVGQGRREEVDIEPAAAGGRNYGWRIREGLIAGEALPVLPAAFLPLIDPVFDYTHSVGQAVTGGFVYRGTRLDASYVGRYFFGDYVSGKLMSMAVDYDMSGEASSAGVVDHTTELGGPTVIGNLSSIDVDGDGELYLVDLRGSIRRVEPGAVLTLSVAGAGSLTAAPAGFTCTTSCSRTVVAGSVLALQAVPAQGWTFAGWNGDADCLDGRLTLSSARTCSATFLPRLAVRPPSRVDFNDDGRADVFAYQAMTGAWTMDLTGTAGSAGSLHGAWHAGWTIRPADFNGDGLTDLFLYDQVTGQWFRALRNQAGDFSYVTSFWPAGLDVRTLDLDGDGRTDVFRYDPASGEWGRCLTPTAGDFVCSVGVWAPGFDVHVAELDGNHDADLFLYDPLTGAWLWAVNDGVSGWMTMPGVWRDRWQVSIGDFNADGRADVFLYDPDSGQWFICTNARTRFTYVTGVWAPGWTVSLADFDGDGRSDVFLYNRMTGEWSQAINGGGGFTYATGLWAPGWQVQIADLNGDLRSDVLLYLADDGAVVPVPCRRHRTILLHDGFLGRESHRDRLPHGVTWGRVAPPTAGAGGGC